MTLKVNDRVEIDDFKGTVTGFENIIVYGKMMQVVVVDFDETVNNWQPCPLYDEAGSSRSGFESEYLTLIS